MRNRSIRSGAANRRNPAGAPVAATALMALLVAALAIVLAALPLALPAAGDDAGAEPAGGPPQASVRMIAPVGAPGEGTVQPPAAGTATAEPSPGPLIGVGRQVRAQTVRILERLSAGVSLAASRALTAADTTAGSPAATSTQPPVAVTDDPADMPTDGPTNGPTNGPTGIAEDAADAANTTGSTAADGRSIDCRKVKCVALTFDDGPGPYTGLLLEYLAAHQARATFFLVGQNAAALPGVVRRTAEAGHEIANHSWSHRDLSRLSRAQVRADLRRADETLAAITGEVPRLVRPPYGALNGNVRAAAGRPLVLWSVDTLDWRHRSTARTVRAVLKHTRPGDIVLMHDIHPASVAALPKVLKGLADRGYHFVTVSELYGGQRLRPGAIYLNRAPSAAHP